MKEFFKTNYLLFVKIILTIYILYALKYLFFLKKIEVHFYTNIAFIFIVFGVAYLVNYTLNTIKNGIDKCLAIISIIMGLYFTFVLILGSFYEGIGLVRVPKQPVQYNDYTLEQFTQSLPYIPALWFMCFGIILSIYLKLPIFFKPILKNKIKLPDKYNSLYKIWIFIFICWLPYFIFLYPGFIMTDVNAQLTQLYTGNFSTHHPLITTFLQYFIIGVYQFTSNGLLSIALYILVLQILPLSFSFAYMLYKIQNIFKINGVIYIFLILFCALYPAHPLWTLILTKDIIFFSLFNIFLTDILILIYSVSSLKNKIFMIKFLLLAIVLCLTRNNVVYSLIFALPLILILAKNYRKKVLFIFTTIIIGYLILNSTMIKLTDAVKGDFKESLSLPLQQLARVYKYHKNDLSIDEKQYIESVIIIDNVDIINKYNPVFSDPIKGWAGYNRWIDTNYFLQKESLLMYFKIGLKYSDTYLNSILLMSRPLWNIFEKTYYHNFVILWERAVPRLKLTLEDLTEPKNQYIYKSLKDIQKKAWTSSFIYFYIFNIQMFFYILLFSFIYFIYKKDYKNIIILLIPLAYSLTVLLGPIVYTRYTYYLYAIFPIIVMMLTNRNNSEMISKTSEK